MTKVNFDVRKKGCVEAWTTDDERERLDDRKAQEGEFGSKNTRSKHDPCQPSEHEMIAFQSWCGHCIKGRGREEDCRKATAEERRVPEILLDYMFMGDEEEGKMLEFLVAREKETKAVFSTAVPTGEWFAES